MSRPKGRSRPTPSNPPPTYPERAVRAYMASGCCSASATYKAFVDYLAAVDQYVEAGGIAPDIDESIMSAMHARVR